jgi:hypothetical protein
LDSVAVVGPDVIEELLTAPIARDNWTSPSDGQLGTTSYELRSVVELTAKEHAPAVPMLVISLAASPVIAWLNERMNVGVRVPTGLAGSDQVAEGIDESIVTVAAETAIDGPLFDALSIADPELTEIVKVPSPAQRTKRFAEVDVLDAIPMAHPGAVPDVARSEVSNSVIGSDQVAVALMIREPVRVADGVMTTVGAVRSMVMVVELIGLVGPLLPAESTTVADAMLNVTVPSAVHVVPTVYSAPEPVTPVMEHGAAPAPVTTAISELMRPDTGSPKSSSNEGVKLLVGLVGAVHVALGAEPSMVNPADVTAVAGPLFNDTSVTLPASNVGMTVPSVEHEYVAVKLTPDPATRGAEQVAVPAVEISIADSPVTASLNSKSKTTVRDVPEVEVVDHEADGMDESIVTDVADVMDAGPLLPDPSDTADGRNERPTVPVLAHARSIRYVDPEIATGVIVHGLAVPVAVKSATPNPVTSSLKTRE